MAQWLSVNKKRLKRHGPLTQTTSEKPQYQIRRILLRKECNLMQIQQPDFEARMVVSVNVVARPPETSQGAELGMYVPIVAIQQHEPERAPYAL